MSWDDSTCSFKSIADLSSVVNFFAFAVANIASKDFLGFRGPGRLGVTLASGCGVLDELGIGDGKGFGPGFFSGRMVGCEPFHSGHFLASGESSATSSTLLCAPVVKVVNKQKIRDSLRYIFTREMILLDNFDHPSRFELSTWSWSGH
jgi:hypothetical protein